MDAMFFVTSYGLEVLAAEDPEATPHDPEGYLKALMTKTGPLDTVAQQYLGEALQTFRQNAHRATMVMLGCASERLLVLLCEEVFTTIKTERPISQVWKDVEKAIAALPAADLKGLREALGEDWEERLESGFQIIRRSRNQAGHPAIMTDVSRFDTRYRFMMFHFYAVTIYGILSHYGHS